MEVEDLVHEILKNAINYNISDIHFQYRDEEVEVYYRTSSGLDKIKVLSQNSYKRLIRYLKFKCKLDPSANIKPNDGSFIFNIDEKKYFIRLSTIKMINHEGLVLRIIYQDNITDKDLNSINLDSIINLYEYMKNNTGIYIFTGPTGSGKTTAMYWLLNKYVTEEHKKVITIENPVEIVNEKFNQIQVNEEQDLDYNVGLKTALRQDPDIIMIGEIRDEKTARNVFRAGLTGHSVITTMHTKNKYGVIERLIDFGFHLSEIKSVLGGISNQRLISYKGEATACFDIAYGEMISELIEGKGNEKDIFKQIQKFKIK